MELRMINRILPWSTLLRLWLTLGILSAAAGSVQASPSSHRNRESWPSQQQFLNAPSDLQDSTPGDVHQQSIVFDSVPVSACNADEGRLSTEPIDTFPAFLAALDVKQSHFFMLWVGKWPAAIDWTAAVMGTFVSAALISLTRSYDYIVPSAAGGGALSLSYPTQTQQNLIDRYFTQITSFYFGENAFSLRTQAYDDMLWVVLGWLENIKFINLHSSLHYQDTDTDADDNNSTAWYGTQFIPGFAHRARLFYDLASQGWDVSLCGGGMIWNPYLKPYKNAITNELFITASISMYLYFPGDDNTSPFALHNNQEGDLPSAKPHDIKHVLAAVQAYDWLLLSNMTNKRGLFVDGFHIRGWSRENGSIGSGQCDERNEMVYTYNQGVLLSGLRGLWEATGLEHYLQDGYSLIFNVIAATGWNIEDGTKRRQWAGLGRNGILEEICDVSGTCSQDGQTFKGIFFHHMTLFCEPLPTLPITKGKTFAADDDLGSRHEDRCAQFAGWIEHNARAALQTRDSNGEFGMWWGHGFCRDGDDLQQVPEGGIDYRNAGVPHDPTWQTEAAPRRVVEKEERRRERRVSTWDVNDRGRGRTVETQAGGMAVLRAMWELVDRRGARR
ncbi:MAG: hypothetical protein M1835_007517 [Candelina submexicana]|nr:MAG: hypothetical protein M1835_007517 [Candelina submexicana]